MRGLGRSQQSPDHGPLTDGNVPGGIAWAAVLSLISGKGRHMIGPSAQRAFSAASAMLFAGLAVKVFLDGLASRV